MLRAHKVLIVDDEERLLRILRLAFKDSPYELRTASNGEEALKELFSQPFDVVVTDVQMPRMNGIELLYEMERYQMRIPVIVMTAHADVNAAVKAFKHGAVDYLSKPFTPDELRQAIDHVLARSTSAEGVAVPVDLKLALEGREKEVIAATLLACADNKAEAAKRLNISERTLWYKVKKYGL
jgi:DNA-binding NtrC family response regulator